MLLTLLLLVQLTVLLLLQLTLLLRVLCCAVVWCGVLGWSGPGGEQYGGDKRGQVWCLCVGHWHCNEPTHQEPAAAPTRAVTLQVPTYTSVAPTRAVTLQVSISGVITLPLHLPGQSHFWYQPPVSSHLRCTYQGSHTSGAPSSVFTLQM
jgi:hypothetical protein